MGLVLSLLEKARTLKSYEGRKEVTMHAYIIIRWHQLFFKYIL